jgi:hypothetical protein
MIQRRKFLLGLTGLIAAPAVVKANSLMKIIGPRTPVLAPYKGRTIGEIALYYCPYVPLGIYKTIDPYTFETKYNFTRG